MKYMKIFSVFPILMLVLIAVGFFMSQPATSLTMDVNPSIEIVTNRLERVVRINPLNEDAELLLKNFTPKDKRLENTINDLVDLMILTGYIHGEKDNFLMITVDNSVNSKLVDKVNRAIAVTLKNKAIEATVLKQSIPKVDKAPHLTGVQLATLRILEIDNSLNPNLLASMTVEQLIQFSYANNIPVESLFTLVANEIDDDPGDTDDAETPSASSLETTAAATTTTTNTTTVTVDANTMDAATTDAATTESTPAAIASTESTGALELDIRMSAADARQTVINKFGGILEKIEYAYDGTNPHYKGQVLTDGSKVVFELNAWTSLFTKLAIGIDHGWDSFSEALPNMITMNQAANLVINKSGLSNTFVQKIDFKWDDSEPLYQGEAFNEGVKYSFEIYAYSGDFKKWDSSTGDETWSKQYFNVR